MFVSSGVSDDERVSKTMDKLSVNFGVEILSLVEGYVSTEVDARLSFDTEGTLERAYNIISLYEAAGERAQLLLPFFFSPFSSLEYVRFVFRFSFLVHSNKTNT